MTIFNRTAPRIGRRIDEPTQDTIEGTFNLRQASLEDAIRYGGPITRSAIGAMEFGGKHKYIVVDTKVSYLMRGMYPAIPGWHTDGVPRGDNLDPGGKGEPKLSAQDSGKINGSRYHLLVTGTISQTEFLTRPLDLDLADGRDLYKNMSRKVAEWLDKGHVSTIFVAPSCHVVEWDWWNIHRAVPSSGSGFRYLIRVTETDHIAPRTELSEFIRAQTQVYLPTEFGW